MDKEKEIPSNPPPEFKGVPASSHSRQAEGCPKDKPSPIIDLPFFSGGTGGMRKKYPGIINVVL